MKKHKWVVVGGVHASRRQSVHECKGCDELVVLPPPRGMTEDEYFKKIKVHKDCELQKVAQVVDA